jgi:hypothetical protein
MSMTLVAKAAVRPLAPRCSRAPAAPAFIRFHLARDHAESYCRGATMKALAARAPYSITICP